MGIWISEIEFKQGNWSKPRRTIIIKQQEEVRKRTTGKKLTSLFKLEDFDKDKCLKLVIMLLFAIKNYLQAKFGTV